MPWGGGCEDESPYARTDQELLPTDAVRSPPTDAANSTDAALKPDAIADLDAYIASREAAVGAAVAEARPQRSLNRIATEANVAVMAEPLSFVAAPGGTYGYEIVTVWTFRTLSIRANPLGLLVPDGIAVVIPGGAFDGGGLEVGHAAAVQPTRNHLLILRQDQLPNAVDPATFAVLALLDDGRYQGGEVTFAASDVDAAIAEVAQ